MLFRLAIFTGDCNITSMESTLWNGVNENRTSISHVMSCSLQVPGIPGLISSIMYVPFLLTEFSSACTSPLTTLWQRLLPPACRTTLLWSNEVLWQFDMWQSRIAAVQKASPGAYGAWQVTSSRREHQRVGHMLQRGAEPGAKPSSSDAQC